MQFLTSAPNFTEVILPFAPAITTLANLSLQTGKFPARFNRRRCCRYKRRRGSTGRCQSTTGRYLTYRQSPRCSRDLCWHVCVPTSPTPRTLASGSRPGGKDIRPRRRCSMSLTASTLRLTASHIADRPRSPRSLRHGLSLDPIKRLHTEFGVSGTALSWIQSYLQDRT